ncbi:hypothetical protein LPTSP3_g33540 [Leptospira kobayashii]|uniref:OsmC-like protein n=1 Tax=Leptospira kobayashii TaxID=1917830 RepID=A0ABN6KIM5_9LEPT|nr:OsmC family protein [Leptospira kobayashii]BDA80424.1 hypothetical protein LPTSP3_g33540 [Leptospira kobayashii]
MANSFAKDIIVRTEKTKYATSIDTGSHRWTADESAEAGGTNLGPAPTQILVAALGSCTSITVRMYADRKEMPLDAVEVSLNLEKTAPDQTKIIRNIKLIGDLTPAQRERLLQVANACPVHKILSGTINIETGLTD